MLKECVMADLIVSISGIRGIIGDSLTPCVATEFGMAYGTFLTRHDTGGERPVVCIGRDSRPSGPMIFAAVASGLMATGCDVVDIDIVTTPGVAVMLRKLGCAGGIVITASHNPVEYNGMKFLRHDGIAYPADEIIEIQKNYFDKTFTLTEALGVGKHMVDTSANDFHVDKVLKVCDPQTIAKQQFKVVLDSVNGAGCEPTARLLTELGCEVIHLNSEPTGLFAHVPEPTATNLAQLGPQILKANAVIGLAQDPDADRLAIIDENGHYIGEEYTLALVTKYVLSQNKGLVAANLSTSRMVDDVAASFGCEVLRTPVGEAHVSNAMVKNKCVIGGEGNGGVIDLRVGPVRDSLLGIALILNLLADTGKTVSQLVAEIPSYFIYKTKYPCSASDVPAMIDKVVSHYQGIAQARSATIDTRDGIRIDLPEGWVQVRGSNTEPIVRVMSESKDEGAAIKLADELKEVANL